MYQCFAEVQTIVPTFLTLWVGRGVLLVLKWSSTGLTRATVDCSTHQLDIAQHDHCHFILFNCKPGWGDWKCDLCEIMLFLVKWPVSWGQIKTFCHITIEWVLEIKPCTKLWRHETRDLSRIKTSAPQHATDRPWQLSVLIFGLCRQPALLREGRLSAENMSINSNSTWKTHYSQAQMSDAPACVSPPSVMQMIEVGQCFRWFKQLYLVY